MLVQLIRYMKCQSSRAVEAVIEVKCLNPAGQFYILMQYINECGLRKQRNI